MSIAIATSDLIPSAAACAAPTSGFLRRGLNAVGSGVVWLFGLAAMMLGLAVLASIPVAQFLVLGYLLEACGRVARSGRLPDGFIGIRTAAKLGGIALGAGLLWLPLYGMSIYVENGEIIDPGGAIARTWKVWLTVLAVVYALHVAAACLRGGQFRHFLNPLGILWLVRRAFRGGMYQETRDQLWDFVVAMRLPYYFWLGVRGFVGAFLWLGLPALLLSQGHKSPILGIAGAVLLGLVVLWLPFLQARFARDNRLRAYRELRAVRADFCRAPLVFALALTVFLLAALPLYLFRIEMIPRDLAFLEGLAFLLFLYPAKLAVGWAYSRPARREAPRHWLFRWAGRLLVWPAVIAYAFVVFISQHTGWEGVLSLFNQHAFQLPVPFVNWNG